MNPMMACGHRADATTYEGKPACAVHAPDPNAYLVVAEPSLAGRQAKCSCGRVANSDASDSGWKSLPFFEYMGEGSKRANDTCIVCRYAEIAHERFSGRLMDSVGSGKWPVGIEPHEFVKHGPFEFDSFYCGCRGWD